MTLKKKLTEDTKTEIKEDSVAADSLKAGSHSVDDPKSMTNKTAMLAQMIGTAHAMTDEHLTKWWEEALARAKEIGHGVGIPDGASAKNKSTIETHGVKEAIAQDVQKILSEQEGLSEEFKQKATTLFEAAVEARVKSEQIRIEEEMQKQFDEELEKGVEVIAEGVEEFLEWATDEWMKDNELAIESSLRNELAQDFLTGLRNLFVENNFNIPEEQVNLVDTMATRIEELEGRLNDTITENADLRKAIEEATIAATVAEVSEGLTVTEAEKLAGLAENLDYDSVEDFKTKLETIKESQFVKDTKKSVLNETMEEVNEDNAVQDDPAKGLPPEMRNYVAAVSRTVRR